jgi:hypothetical protein
MSMKSNRRKRSVRRNQNVLSVEKQEVALLKAQSHWPPPPLPTPFRGSTSLRYQANAASTAVVTVMSLCRLLNFTTTTTQAESLIEAVRIHSIEIWLPPYTTISGTSSSIIDSPAPECDVTIDDSAAANFGVRRNISLVAGEKGSYYRYKPRGIFGQWISVIDNYVNATPVITIAPTDCFPVVQLNFGYQITMDRSPALAAALTVGTVVDTTAANAVVVFPLDNYESSGTEGTQVLQPIGVASITVNDPLPDPKALPVLSVSSSSQPIKCAPMTLGGSRGTRH